VGRWSEWSADDKYSGKKKFNFGELRLGEVRGMPLPCT
jgi:hypothetical protein